LGTSFKARGGAGSRPIWALVVLCFACLACLPSTALGATEAHVFDPTLSLTGGCSTDGSDSVADPWCPGPPGPSAPFDSPNIAIDSYGDMYVASFGKEGDGRIDVFGPDGQFITEIPEPNGPGPLAVDSNGHLYVQEYIPGEVLQIVRYSPTVYKPEQGEIEYGEPPVVVVPKFSPGLEFLPGWNGIAVDPTTDRLFVGDSELVGEFGSVEEENKLLDATIGKGTLSIYSKYVAVDASRNRLFVSDTEGGVENSVIRVFELKAPHKLLGTIDGSDTSSEKFLSGSGYLTVDADEETGHVFVADLANSNKVFEFGPGLDEEEELIEKYEHKFKYVFPGEVAIDNAPASPNKGTLYVPSAGIVDHTYAFKYVKEGPPLVEAVSFAGVTEDEVVLRATINPEGADTTYRFEYMTEQAFEEGGEDFSGATVADEGALPAGVEGDEVSTPVTGLEPGVTYRFRVVAVNSQGEDEGQEDFRTYAPASFEPCSNEALRTGLSALLPDCRAYELVTPPDTNGRAPKGTGDTGVYFATLQSSPEGDKASFRVEGGSLPGSEGSGTFNGENYLAIRGSEGWETRIAAPSGVESMGPNPGSTSPDQEYSFWGEIINTRVVAHVRYPDGHSEYVGRGSLGESIYARAYLLAEHGAHIIFVTEDLPISPAPQLEPNAPPEGTTAVYDRTSDEVTHVVSLLPGDITPAAGQNASYAGASYDGEGIAFEIGSTLYLRYQNEETFEIGKNVTYAGMAEGGGRIFYLEGDDLFAFDVASEETIPFSSSGDVTPVNVSADGSAAYLVSPSVLTVEENPNGDTAQLGKDNLYLSEEGGISFVATVTALDMGQPVGEGQLLGLGQWVGAITSGQIGRATSRSSVDGSALLFESEAPLAGYDPDGFEQIYRYDSAAGTLDCLSCSPTLAPAGSGANLQSAGVGEESPITTFARVPNLAPDGQRAFFQSSEALVMGDTDGLQDVYEWEAQGVGSCERAGGCVYLISYGNSARDDHLFSVSRAGDDVFFQTSDLLLGIDDDETPSLYDARVGGGFPELASVPCQEESCRPDLAAPPPLPAPHTPVTGATEPPPPIKCAKGKRKVVRKGKVRCIKKHRKHHRKVGNKRKAGK
jgi:Fibronectin type III domain